MDFFDLEKKNIPFSGYREYTEHLFACVDRQLCAYIEHLMQLFASDGGGFKNVLYPDIEIARDLCEKHLADFRAQESGADGGSDGEEPLPDELASLFAGFGEESSAVPSQGETDIADLMAYIDCRAALTEEPLPLYDLCAKLHFSPFT
ncbi:MAG: hypothetical protein IJA73_01070, partial [Oscillospiraceae bacterium]|nr:hypothetical protein [Oscillospiraceae bacterium]